MGNTYREVLLRASSFLEANGHEGYAIEYVTLQRRQWSKTDWLLNMHKDMLESERMQVDKDVAALMNHYPAQYIIGSEEFYGQRFKVSEATLIPRPETEELVALCLAQTSATPQTVVDIGTGTGAIAISLQLARPMWQVTALDLSLEALAVAQENAQQLQAQVDFVHSDVLANWSGATIDLLISNPPYISNDEWSLMDESVRTFEPKMALFAEENGLAIYQKIAVQAQSLLNPEGQIFLEIGFQQGEAVADIFQKAFPTKEVQVLPDMSGLDRMVWVR